MRTHKRNNMIDIYTSIYFNRLKKEIIIRTGAGRPCRPLYYMKTKTDNNMNIIDKIPSYLTKYTKDIFNNKINWDTFIYGFKEKNNILEKTNIIKYSNTELNKLKENQCIIEYIDTQEAEGCILAKSKDINNNIVQSNVSHIAVLL